MTLVQRGFIISLLCLLPIGLPGSLPAQDSPENRTEALAALLKEQNSALSGDLRRIQREIAALRADLEKPGVKDIFGGIGYIFGLFGVAVFVAARRKG